MRMIASLQSSRLDIHLNSKFQNILLKLRATVEHMKMINNCAHGKFVSYTIVAAMKMRLRMKLV